MRVDASSKVVIIIVTQKGQNKFLTVGEFKLSSSGVAVMTIKCK